MTAPVTWRPSAREALDRVKTKLFATSTEAAVILDIHPTTLRSAIARGEIPATRAGATWRVPVSWLREQVGPDTGNAGDST